MQRTFSWIAMLGAALFVAPLAGNAQDEPASGEAPRIQIFGFGGWGYGRTDTNRYGIGTEEGNYQHANLALGIAAAPYERLTVRSQVEFLTDYVVGNDESEVELDYAFAEYAASDALRLRVGQVKQPFGIYTEVYSVGTVRPFYMLPYGLYGPAEFLSEAFKGVGVSGILPSVSGWEVEYDVYGGALDGLKKGAGILHFLEEEAGEPGQEHDSEAERAVVNTVGGRLVLNSPFQGLRVGVSGYTGTVGWHEHQDSEDESAADDDTRVAVYGMHLDYSPDRVLLRTEAARHHHEGAEVINTAYAEAGFYVTPNWQIAARYDWAEAEIDGFEMADSAPALLRHRDTALGLNYWFNPSLVVKASYHNVDGNLFAVPDSNEALSHAIRTGALRGSTRLITVGAQFSF